MMRNAKVKSAKSNEILRMAKDERGVRQTELAERLGMAQASLSGNMNRPRIGLDVFAKLLDAMGYDVTIVDRESGKELWKVEV